MSLIMKIVMEKQSYSHFASLQDVKDFGFIIYKMVEGQEWWANKDGEDKKDISIEKLKLVKNVDKSVAHIYVNKDLMRFTMKIQIK